MSAPQIINGTICRNCDDVDRARKAQRLGLPTSDIGPTGDIKQKSDKTVSATAADDDALRTTGDRGLTLNLWV